MSAPATSPRLPAVFFGHGSPMNTLARNRFTAAWAALGHELSGARRPRAILAISAHWYIGGTAVTAASMPVTIHDFSGFPRELHEFRYPAEGDPALAAEVQKLLAPLPVALDQHWGLDHGVWSVLAHVFPAADVPVVQLSLDRHKPPAFFYELGRTLAPLRDEAVLLAGFGNVVHNLRLMRRDEAAAPYDWAQAFEDRVRDAVLARDHRPLIDLRADEATRLAVPTPEHYLPLLPVLGTQGADESASVPVAGIDLASISMLSVRVG